MCKLACVRVRGSSAQEVEQGKGETGDPPQEHKEGQGGDRQTCRLGSHKLEEQMQETHKKIGEIVGSNETSMEEGSASWRREGEGEEWQTWNGAWWNTVEQTNL